MAEKIDRKQQQAKLAAKIKKLIKAIDLKPKDPQQYYALGMLLTKAQQYTQAEELFKRAINFFKHQHLATDLLEYGLGNVLYSAGLYQKSLTVFQQVKSADLKNDAYLMIAQNYYAQENYQQALVFALTVSEQAKTQQADGWLLAGESLLALGNLKLAAKYFDQVLVNRPTNFQANFERGVIEMVWQQESERFFKQAKKSDPVKFAHQQERLADIERVLIAKQQGETKGGKQSDSN
ncbi:tetratricopeptide repeat protein [Liquorilactobacillus sicerae]|uniref:tetratricopeptide repeat protein n=1 Tax=Liquorilactobacillus sicerae TaxID=1416943 RepID=UPI00247FA3EB|nr:tetratricopeptide repeat protein [Liquorilactobacillus sicerae]